MLCLNSPLGFPGEGNGNPLQYSYLENPMGRRSLVGCSPWGLEELDTTKRLQFHFSLSRIGEGSGNPLQCSCLENPRDGGAWWADVYGVAQSRTRLKRLSSRSSSWCSQNIFTFIILFYSHRKLSQEIKQGRDWGLGRRTLYLWATLSTFFILEKNE